jgi:hypothetical protein
MLGAADWVVIVAYFAVIAAIGVWAGRKGKTTEDYFLGGRRMPWFTAMLSLMATEASAVTFIGTPGESFGGNMWYAQMAIGSLAARIIVAVVFLGAFYKFRVCWRAGCGCVSWPRCSTPLCRRSSFPSAWRSWPASRWPTRSSAASAR